jgi:hypothetical protein
VLHVISIDKPVVQSIVTTKSITTYTNCGKTCHTFETCHNWKREVAIIPTAIINFTKPVVGSKPQLLNLSGCFYVILVSSILVLIIN